VRRLRQLRTEHGVRSFVGPCPIRLGRDAALMREIAEKSEMNVVCTTGFYFEEMGLPIYWRARTVTEIAELYIRELTHGIGTTGVKAGAIKVATGGWLPPYTHLFTNFVPMLKDRGLSDHEVDAIRHDNPRRFFAGEPLPRMNEV